MRDLASYVSLAVIVIYFCDAIAPCAASAAQSSTPPPAVAPQNAENLIPCGGVAGKQLQVNFKGSEETGAIVVSHTETVDGPPYCEHVVKVMKYNAGSGWTAAFEERYPMEPVQDEILLERVRAANGKEAAVVILYHSGAGTATDWHIIAEKSGKFGVLDPRPLRDKALRRYSYPFMGYNRVKVNGDLVSEELPGYSKGRARCCPDRPSIRMNVRFTGSAIKLNSVMEVPGTPR